MIKTERPIVPLAPWKRKLITFFIIFNVSAIALGGVPKARGARNAAENFFYPYLLWTRLHQEWRLFAPNTRTETKHYHVKIEFANGSKVTWQRPYPPNWGFFERHLSYNYQKWDSVWPHLETFPSVRLDLARHIEHLYANPANPPTLISLIRSRATWPAPNPEGYAFPHDGELQWADDEMFTYSVGIQAMIREGRMFF